MYLQGVCYESIAKSHWEIVQCSNKASLAQLKLGKVDKMETSARRCRSGPLLPESPAPGRGLCRPLSSEPSLIRGGWGGGSGHFKLTIRSFSSLRMILQRRSSCRKDARFESQRLILHKMWLDVCAFFCFFRNLSNNVLAESVPFTLLSYI